MLDARVDRYALQRKLSADAGHQGPKFRDDAKQVRRGPEVVILKRSAPVFNVLSGRGVVERTFAWLSRRRRHVKNFECCSRSALAFFRRASVQRLLRELCNPG